MKNKNNGIVGFKFFQPALDRLNIEYFEANHLEDYRPLAASTISVYILYHGICDEYGRIAENEHCFRELSRVYQFNASTLVNGHYDLINRGLLKEVSFNGEVFYEITHYAEFNSTSVETGKQNSSNNLNYFKIPFAFLYTLNEYIRSRDSKGLLYILDLINCTYREYSMRSKSTTSSIERLLNTIKSQARKNSRNIHSFLSRARTIFNFKEISGRKKKNEKYLISFVSLCFKEFEEDSSNMQLDMKMKKDITNRFTNSHLLYRRSDIRDVFYSLKSELLDIVKPFHTNNSPLQRLVDRFLFNSYSAAMDQLLSGKEIHSIGAYFRNALRTSMKKFLAFHMSLEELIDFWSFINAWGLDIKISMDEVYKLRKNNELNPSV